MAFFWPSNRHLPSFFTQLVNILQKFGQPHLEARQLGDLWLQMLRFYSITFDRETFLVSILSASKVKKSSRNWPTKKLVIEGRCAPSPLSPSHDYGAAILCADREPPFFSLKLDQLIFFSI